jgi:hypothetical protein
LLQGREIEVRNLVNGEVAAVKRLQSGYSVARLAREIEVNANQLHLLPPSSLTA